MNKTALFFPGQGSQSVGMMAGFISESGDNPIIKQIFTEASDILKTDFWAMATEPNEWLNLTQNTQPLMLIAGVATHRAYIEAGGLQANIHAGHSLGEYTALVASNALSFADALPLVKYRAESMQNAVPEGVGAMAAILGLEDELVREACLEAAQSEVCEAAWVVAWVAWAAWAAWTCNAPAPAMPVPCAVRIRPHTLRVTVNPGGPTRKRPASAGLFLVFARYSGMTRRRACTALVLSSRPSAA